MLVPGPANDAVFGAHLFNAGLDARFFNAASGHAASVEDDSCLTSIASLCPSMTSDDLGGQIECPHDIYRERLLG